MAHRQVLITFDDRIKSQRAETSLYLSKVSQPNYKLLFLHTALFYHHSVPSGLAVDYFNERLYWSDAKLSVIGSVRLDGSDPVIAASGIKNS